MKPTEDQSNFSWGDMVRAFYFLLDSKRGSYIFYTITLILVLFYDFIPVIVVGSVVDFFTTYTVGDSLTPFYILVAFLTITYGVVSLIRLTVKKKLADIKSQVAYFTKVRGFERLLDFSIKWHDAENTGNKVQKIQAGADAMKQMQVLLSTDVFRYITALVGVIIAFAYLQPTLLVFALAYITIFAVVQVSFYRRSVELSRQNNVLSEKAGGTYYEGLSNILTIKTLGVKDDFKTNVQSKEALTRDNSLRKINLINNKWKFFQIINAVSIGAVLFFAGKGFVAGVISLGSIFIIYNYFHKLNDAAIKSGDVVDNFIAIKETIGRMMPIFWDDTRARQGHLEFPLSWNAININKASFKYHNKTENALDENAKDRGITDLTLRVNRYEKVGVVGKSGSGKSTLAKMLLGLYEFDSGEFTIGETNFYDIKHDGVTKEIALVLQDSEMFNLSLKENITLMRKFDKELFEKALSISQLGDVTEKLPNGIDTLIGEKGYRLSGGERQRIGIARAIYKDPQILVLDEATSSLDSKTETLIQKGLEEELTKKTVISIAHRVSTLKNVDKMVVFEDGKIVEEGTFDELSKDSNSKFSEISNTSMTSQDSSS